MGEKKNQSIRIGKGCGCWNVLNSTPLVEFFATDTDYIRFHGLPVMATRFSSGDWPKYKASGSY